MKEKERNKRRGVVIYKREKLYNIPLNETCLHSKVASPHKRSRLFKNLRLVNCPDAVKNLRPEEYESCVGRIGQKSMGDLI